MVIEYVGERWTYSESPCTNNSKGSYSLQCCQLCSDIWGKMVLWKMINASLKFVSLCLKRKKKKHLWVCCFYIWYPSKRGDFKDKRLLMKENGAMTFLFLHQTNYLRLTLTHINIFSLPMCDSRNCLEKGSSFRNKILYLAVFQPQTLSPKVAED